MTVVKWDQTGDRLYETGVDRGVLYIPTDGVYVVGYAWNGLVGVTESPSGAEASPLYADNTKYLNLISNEEFGATVEAYTYPEEFGQCDGTAAPKAGVLVGQQSRKAFGLAYRTKLGNDVDASDHGYKLHLVYGALAAPSEKAYATVNDSPEAITFSWELTTTAVDVTGFKPTAILTIDSTKVDAGELASLEDLLYGTAVTDPSLPLPDAVVALFGAEVVISVVASAPTYDDTTDEITIPVVTGVAYSIDGSIVTGAVAITSDTIVTAAATEGYVLGEFSDNDWYFTFV